MHKINVIKNVSPYVSKINVSRTCPNTASLVAEKVRRPMRQLLGSRPERPPARLRPLSDPRQIHTLSDMGISVLTLPDGRVQLLYTTSTVNNCICFFMYPTPLPDIGFSQESQEARPASSVFLRQNI